MKTTRSTVPKTTVLTSGNCGFGWTDHGDGTATVASTEWGGEGTKRMTMPLDTVEAHAAELRRAGWR